MEEIEAAAQQLRDWIAEREREKAEAIESRDSQTEAATLVQSKNPEPFPHALAATVMPEW